MSHMSVLQWWLLSFRSRDDDWCVFLFHCHRWIELVLGACSDPFAGHGGRRQGRDVTRRCLKQQGFHQTYLWEYKHTHTHAGWWFGTWLLFSPIVGMMIQSGELIFFRGVGIQLYRSWDQFCYAHWPTKTRPPFPWSFPVLDPMCHLHDSNSFCQNPPISSTVLVYPPHEPTILEVVGRCEGFHKWGTPKMDGL